MRTLLAAFLLSFSHSLLAFSSPIDSPLDSKRPLLKTSSIASTAPFGPQNSTFIFGTAIGSIASTGRVPTTKSHHLPSTISKAKYTSQNSTLATGPTATGQTSEPSSGRRLTSTNTKTASSSMETESFPVWNLNNITCADLTTLDASEQWSAVEGDKVVETFNKMFAGNKLVCYECFGMDKGACASENPECENGLRDLATPEGTDKARWDTAAAIFAKNADLTDLMCQIRTGECSAAPNCKSCDGPGGFALLKSLQTMHNTLQNIYNAIGQAGAAATLQMTEFSKTFAPVPSIKDEAMFLTIMVGIVGGLAGFIPGVGGASAGLLIAVGSGVLLEEFFFGAPQPADTSTILGTIVNATQNSYSHLADTLFSDGSYTFTSADGKETTSITLANLMKDGDLMKDSGNASDFYTALVPTYQRVLFQQLALYTWQHLEVDDVQHVPFIAFDKKPCDQVDHSNDTSIGSLLEGVKSLDANITYDGNCYYLLDGKPTSKTTGIGRDGALYKSCSGANHLPGGTNKDMSENAQIFSQLSIGDFIIPSVKGWAQNHHQNGYPSAAANGQLVSGPDDTAAVNIPVCDYMGNPDSPGVGCPKIKTRVHGKGCDTWPVSSGTNQLGDYIHGWCKVHIEQWQKHHGNDNPLGSFQLSATITDDGSRDIGHAAKQAAANSLAIVNSVLPFNLVVAAGAADDDPIQFWYADQYWNSSSSENQCSIGGYEDGNRGLECGFHCPLPDPGSAAVSATAAHPFPNTPTAAIGGYTTFTNTYQTASSTSTAVNASSTGPSPKPTYATGKCSVHIKQFQKNDKESNPTGDYQIEATIFDATPDNKGPIGTSGHVPAPEGEAVSVNGLVSPLTITTGAVDEDPLTINFDGKIFKTSDEQCDVGDYDSGARDMDCHFDC